VSSFVVCGPSLIACVTGSMMSERDTIEGVQNLEICWRASETLLSVENGKLRHVRTYKIDRYIHETPKCGAGGVKS